MVHSPLLILKTGHTVDSLRSEGEDFEDWITAGCGLPQSAVVTVEVFKGAKLPAVDSISGIIITGSPAYVTDHDAWNERAADYLRDAVRRQLPVLGICYGHQLLAYALGGEVGFHPRGREIGTATVWLHGGNAAADALLGELPASFKAQVSHLQTVIRPPGGSTVLASNDFEPYHALRFGPLAWGVQFHPEFNPRIMLAYLQQRQDSLRSEGLDVDALMAEVAPTPEAATVLTRFAALLRP
ncbi:MAG: hypothetical protein RLZZ385_690 [Pseudomonadota bacterium]|jgi:GMP synthase (glutamine-hydrolysing)